jgi:two-component system phosphate regulon sensor histidine kinase PhoR
VANVSHELRTPVSIIRANAETLLDGAVDDPVHARPLLEAAHRNAERLSHIIADLLDLSRLEAGRYEIHRAAVPAAEVAGRAIDAVGRAASERGTAIRDEVPAALAVQADDKALEQVLVNYLENAVKYTPPGGQIRVAARKTGDRVRIEVCDNGPGIDARHRARVFERFYRVDPGRSRDMGGTGLGLSIVKHMAEAMGGAVGVDPVEPHGSAFWIELQAAVD